MNEKVSKKKRKSIFKSRPKLHLCTFPNCGKRFPSTCHLEIHNRIHTGEKPYKCRLCFKRFSQSGTLIIHERTHTGDKPYQCKVCLQRFTQTGSLNNHERIHTVGQATFKCPFCRKRIHSHHMAIHMKTIHGMSNEQIDLLRRKRALKRKSVSKFGKEAPAPIKANEALQPLQNTTLVCLECPKRDTDLASLKNHMKEAHGLELGANFDKTLLLLEWPQFINSTIKYLE